MTAFIEVHGNPMICDFCSSSDKPQHTYGCKSFTVECSGQLLGRPVSESQGNWLACPACRELIDAGNWEQLAKRSTELFIVRHPEGREYYAAIYQHMRDLHQEFRRARLATH